MELIGNRDVETTAVANGAEALTRIKRESFDTMVLDLRLPDMSGLQLLEKMSKADLLQNLPVIIYTGKELSAKEETRLKRLSDSIIIIGCPVSRAVAGRDYAVPASDAGQT